ncbi:hypothetical protein KIL84_018352 [Mauremys mutica]|uniref:Uncharacterized protein n=1 Tax=Mauremys mutica TaxID=74926 RepID=A0A9D3XUH9_9SAUR|nr:hypothetical protein KIL84_018352 [Mauremys mutica]
MPRSYFPLNLVSSFYVCKAPDVSLVLHLWRQILLRSGSKLGVRRKGGKTSAKGFENLKGLYSMFIITMIVQLFKSKKNKQTNLQIYFVIQYINGSKSMSEYTTLQNWYSQKYLFFLKLCLLPGILRDGLSIRWS